LWGRAKGVKVRCLVLDLSVFGRKNYFRTGSLEGYLGSLGVVLEHALDNSFAQIVLVLQRSLAAETTHAGLSKAAVESLGMKHAGGIHHLFKHLGHVAEAALRGEGLKTLGALPAVGAL
jgi:hypothetical protein